MERELIEFPGLTIAGVSFYGDPFGISSDWSEDNAIGQTWKRFMSLFATLPQGLFSRSSRMYEVHVSSEETKRTGHREIFVGCVPSRGIDIPVDLSLKTLPPCTCVAAVLRGREITDGWEELYSEGIPEGFGPGPWLVQEYGPDWVGLKPGEIERSSIRAYVPIVSVRTE